MLSRLDKLLELLIQPDTPEALAISAGEQIGKLAAKMIDEDQVAIDASGASRALSKLVWRMYSSVACDEKLLKVWSIRKAMAGAVAEVMARTTLRAVEDSSSGLTDLLTGLAPQHVLQRNRVLLASSGTEYKDTVNNTGNAKKELLGALGMKEEELGGALDLDAELKPMSSNTSSAKHLPSPHVKAEPLESYTAGQAATKSLSVREKNKLKRKMKNEAKAAAPIVNTANSSKASSSWPTDKKIKLEEGGSIRADEDQSLLALIDHCIENMTSYVSV